MNTQELTCSIADGADRCSADRGYALTKAG
jgi:hypothetical protein